MGNIVISDFSAGWTPGDDPIKGRRNGLLRMDNLELDSNGALTLAGGASIKQEGFPAAAHTLYSRSVNGTRHDYSLLANGAGYRDATSLWASGGDTTNGAFGTAFNYTLIMSGAKRYKDNGSSIVGLGVPPALAPTFSTRTAVYTTPLTLGTATFTPAAYSSSFSSPYLTLDTAPSDAGLSIIQSNALGGIPYNWLLMSDGSASTDDDYLEIFPVFNATNLIGSQAEQLQIDIMLDAPASPGAQVSNYYTYTIQSDGFGVNDWIRIRRADFNKVGPGLKDWSTVYGFRITYISLTGVNNSMNIAGVSDSLKFKGGVHAQNGTYVYYQMNVNNTGSYLAKSELSPPTATQIQLSNETAHILYQHVFADPQINEVWLFRQGGLLDKPYRVLVIPSASWSGSAVADPFSDAEALELNISYDFNLVSWNNVSTVFDRVFDIVGPVNGRWYFFNESFMYPSDLNDPDLFNSALGVRTCGSSSELFMWARQVSAETILVGTSLDVYALSGTFATFPDGSIDLFYRPLGVQYPPLTCDAVEYGGSVYYLARDGWRLISPGGENPSLVSPNLDRLYKGEDVSGYSHPNLKIIPRSARFPIVIAKNKMWCFITGVSTPRIEVYDFVRQYWRAVTYYPYSDFSAATFTQDGQILVFFGTDHKLREIDIQTSKLLDGSLKQAPVFLSMVFDGGYPRQRKDSSTLKLRSSSTDSINAVITTEESGLVAVGPFLSSSTVQDQAFDLSQLDPTIEIGKTYQVRLGAGAVIADLTIEDLEITYDLRPEQRTFIRVQSNNYGTTARKRIATIPFQLDTIGGDVRLDAYLDGTLSDFAIYTSNRKASFNFEFANSAVLPIAKDYEYTLSSSNLFEFFGFQEPRIVEVYPQQCVRYVLPVTNYGNANKKRIRVRPFVLSAPASVTVFFHDLVDGTAQASSIFSVGIEKKTFFHFNKTDVFGVDYGGDFSAASEFEVGDVLPPEIVQVLPIAKQFDQVGPEEFFRYGKIKMIELRVLAFGSSVPFTIYFSDTPNYVGAFDTTYGKEVTQFIMLPKGTSGNIVRIELGPTNFDFHRFYTRLQVTRSGRATDLEWINL